MIQALKKLFKRKPKPSNKMRLGTRIRLRKDTKAYKVYTSLEVTVKSDMLLMYRGERDGRIFFFVRSCFHSNDTTIARDKDLVYFYKPCFDKLDYVTN